jgi:sugar phosphate isomerase/epimerase
MPPGDASPFALPAPALALAGLDASWPELARASSGGGRSTSPAQALRDTLAALSAAGVRHVQLDATHAAIRPRDLDRSARRDLAALLRRLELSCSGLDIMVPPEHLAGPAHADRAVAAVCAAIALAGDLASLRGGAVVARRTHGDARVSLVLPDRPLPDVLTQISAAAELHGVLVADHRWPPGDTSAGSGGIGPVGVGLDPATLLVQTQDPVAAVAQTASRLHAARLSDLARGLGAVRVAPGSGSGRLDVLAYRVALVAAGFTSPPVLDLRAVAPSAGGLRAVLSALA